MVSCEWSMSYLIFPISSSILFVEYSSHYLPGADGKAINEAQARRPARSNNNIQLSGERHEI